MLIDVTVLKRIDIKSLPILFFLMLASLLIISSASSERESATFFTPLVYSQIRWFAIGTLVYLFFAALDYHYLRKWTWVLYGGMLLMLVGLFFTTPIQNVHRWYRVPFLPIALQPSEFAKLIIVITLSSFLEMKAHTRRDWRIVVQGGILVGIPFLLILKQPDLGSALILYPMTLVMFYFGEVNKKVVVIMSWLGLLLLGFTVAMLLGFLDHEELKPTMTTFMKEYQYERLSPNNYHQNAAQTAIALGSLTGSGWNKSEYTAQHWLPFAYTDSVFPAFTEEFGLIGGLVLLLCYYFLIYMSCQITAVAKDYFGRVLSAGISVYIAIHVIINVGMMCGVLPITGVPLLLVTSGGSSVIAAMMALGILQSVYTRRFMF